MKGCPAFTSSFSFHEIILPMFCSIYSADKYLKMKFCIFSCVSHNHGRVQLNTWSGVLKAKESNFLGWSTLDWVWTFVTCIYAGSGWDGVTKLTFLAAHMVLCFVFVARTVLVALVFWLLLNTLCPVSKCPLASRLAVGKRLGEDRVGIVTWIDQRDIPYRMMLGSAINLREKRRKGQRLWLWRFSSQAAVRWGGSASQGVAEHLPACQWQDVNTSFSLFLHTQLLVFLLKFQYLYPWALCLPLIFFVFFLFFSKSLSHRKAEWAKAGWVFGCWLGSTHYGIASFSSGFLARICWES